MTISKAACILATAWILEHAALAVLLAVTVYRVRRIVRQGGG